MKPWVLTLSRKCRPTTLRRASHYGLSIPIICIFLLLRTHFTSCLRGSRARRLRNENVTIAKPTFGNADVVHRKLVESAENEEWEERKPSEEVAESIEIESNAEEYEGWENMTDHEIVLRRARVDLRNLSLAENRGLDLGNADPAVAANQIMKRITSNLERRISKLFQDTRSVECREKVATHFSLFVDALGTESSLPFTDIKLNNSCFFGSSDDTDETEEDLERELEDSWNYQPPRSEATYIDDPSKLNILYGILAHSDPDAVIRLVDTLYEVGHTFVVHVDGKEGAEGTLSRISEFASSRSYVHVVPDPFRVRVNWGGFSMVNATLQVLKYAFAIDRPDAEPLQFHKFAHLAESTYPIRSNSMIRRQLAEYPIDANFMHIIKTPTNPHEDSWHYFIECDDAVHRIYRLPPLRWTSGGIDLMTSSQWFVLSREFAKYLADASPGTLVHTFLEYAEHMVVADEQFFGTVLRHTEFCHKHHNSNFLFLEFGKWEDSKETDQRDPKKCIMPDPNHCGRSPTSIREDMIPALALSNKRPLFARKFVKDSSSRVKSTIDDILRDESKRFDTTFMGNGLMIVAKGSLRTESPLCLGLGRKRTEVNLVPCFHEGNERAPGTLWEYGGVDLNETPVTNRWRLGSCTFDGSLERKENGELRVILGKYSEIGPVCTIELMGGEQRGNCLEIALRNETTVGTARVSTCSTNHLQFFSFGTGSTAPLGSLYISVSAEKSSTDSDARAMQASRICLGEPIGDDVNTVLSSDEDGSTDGDEDEDEDENHMMEEELDEEYSGDELDDQYLVGDIDGESNIDEEFNDRVNLEEFRRRLQLDTELTDDFEVRPMRSGPVQAMDCFINGVIEWVFVLYRN